MRTVATYLAQPPGLSDHQRRWCFSLLDPTEPPRHDVVDDVRCLLALRRAIWPPVDVPWDDVHFDEPWEVEHACDMLERLVPYIERPSELAEQIRNTPVCAFHAS